MPAVGQSSEGRRVSVVLMALVYAVIRRGASRSGLVAGDVRHPRRGETAGHRAARPCTRSRSPFEPAAPSGGGPGGAAPQADSAAPSSDTYIPARTAACARARWHDVGGLSTVVGAVYSSAGSARLRARLVGWAPLEQGRAGAPRSRGAGQLRRRAAGAVGRRGRAGRGRQAAPTTRYGGAVWRRGEGKEGDAVEVEVEVRERRPSVLVHKDREREAVYS